MQVEPASGLSGDAAEHSGISRERKRDLGQLVYAHPSSYRYCRHLGQFDRTLADNMTAQDLSRPPLDD
jgi:hypothetical protein